MIQCGWQRRYMSVLSFERLRFLAIDLQYANCKHVFACYHDAEFMDACYHGSFMSRERVMQLGGLPRIPQSKSTIFWRGSQALVRWNVITSVVLFIESMIHKYLLAGTATLSKSIYRIRFVTVMVLADHASSSKKFSSWLVNLPDPPNIPPS